MTEIELEARVQDLVVEDGVDPAAPASATNGRVRGNGANGHEPVFTLTRGPADADSHSAGARIVTARTVSVVIPTLNEEKNIAWVLERLPAFVDEVILVDGRSTDRTVATALQVRSDIRIVLESRPGKGAALRAGFAAAEGDYIVMIDADGSMVPAEIERFVRCLEEGCDFVKGTRFGAGGGTSDMSAVRRSGNLALLRAVNLLYRTNFTDLCYGFIAFRRDRLSALRLAADGFEIETEMIVRAVIAGLRIAEVPSFEHERRNGDSNLRAWRDGRRALNTLLRQRIVLPEARLVPTPSVAR
jgi:glycosyltransferase involved in cell wall biosynthesis